MSENVEHAVGPILQSIQERLTAIETTLGGHSAKFDEVLDEVRGLKRMSKAALGVASGAELVAEDAERAAERANRRIDELAARIEALESR